MGTYLSTPVLEKCHEEGESLNNKKKSFAWAVVDMQGWRKTMEDAHIVETEATSPNINIDPYSDTAKIFAVFDGHGGVEVARFCQLYFVSVLTNQKEWKGISCKVDICKALINTFHQLDCMLNSSFRRDEITNLKLHKPNLGEKRSIADNNTSSTFSIENVHEIIQGSSQCVYSNCIRMEEPLQSNSKFELYKNIKFIDYDNTNKYIQLNNSSKFLSRVESSSIIHQYYMETEDKLNGMNDLSYQSVTENETESSIYDKSPHISKKKLTTSHLSLDQSLVTDVLSADSSRRCNVSPTTFNGFLCKSNQIKINSATPLIKPTKLLNGRQVCNLPDHPITAGCTSICAVIVGKVLTVANAGDSRAVLCREGCVTEPLSFDHKPMYEIEMKRIVEAGGFVNHFGRVNGNLNLSRSIGDLKYKQVPSLPPSSQIITAEPDIIQITLLPNDEFIILACDGVWDCLSNEEVVNYVYEHIDSKTPAIIGIELLNKIVSPDPRASQGIGGDNMTLMVIDLLPKKRSYRVEKNQVKYIDPMPSDTLYLNNI